MQCAAVSFSQILPTREIVISPYKLGSSNFVKLPKIPSKRNPKTSTDFSLGIRSENTSILGDKDAVIVVDHGSRRKESNLMLNEFVTMFKGRTGYKIVEPAHMELAEPSIRDAFNLCVQQGAKRIIVSPFFLSPGRHWHKDIPSLAAEAASEHFGISYIVTAPLGLHELMVSFSHTGKILDCNACSEVVLTNSKQAYYGLWLLSIGYQGFFFKTKPRELAIKD